MRGLVNAVKNHPPLGTALILIAVLLHRTLYYVVPLPLPDVVAATENSPDAALATFLGFAAVVAILAGFAGVVIVFALSAGSERFVLLRHGGADRLEANWVSPVATSFAAAFGCLGCAVLSMTSHPAWAWWLFEFLLLISALASARLMWLLRRLVVLVREDDSSRVRDGLKVNLVDLNDIRRH